MATKTSAKKETSRAESSRPKSDHDILAKITDEFLTQKLYQAIVAHGEPAKLADIQKSLEDDSISLGLIKQGLVNHPQRFVQVDRRWDVSTRYLDRQRPAIKILEEIISMYGTPMAAWDAAHELGVVFRKSTEGQQNTSERLLTSSPGFFGIQAGSETKYGLR